MRLIALLVAAISLSGCVMSSTHETLQKQYATAQAKIARLEIAVSEQEQAIVKLEAERDALREQLLAHEKTIASLQKEQASMLKDKSQLQASIEKMGIALAELDQRRLAAEGRINEFKQLLARFKPLIDAGSLRVKIVDGRMVVEMATDVLFASGKAELSEEGDTAIKEVAAVLATIPERRFQIEGHTDNVPIKTRKYPSNWELAAARSLRVVKTMVEAGLPATRVSGGSFAEHKPVLSNEADEGRAANRRIEIVLVPDLSSLPGFDELKKMNGGQG